MRPVALACSAVLSAVALVCACSSGSSGAPSASPDTAQTRTGAAPAADASRDAALVDIGGGHHLFAVCEGKGSPTILLENGDESDVSQWRLEFPTLVAHSRTCSYDRLGVGNSDFADGCREMKDLQGDLEALLSAEHETGPFLLVGTSGGGFLMAGYAYAHPANVAGMVLAETPHAIVPAQESPSLLRELTCDSASNQERRDYVRVENDAWSHRHRIGDIPMTVITNDYGDLADGQEQRTNVAGQKGWLVLSPQARQIIVTSGHDVPGNEPDLLSSEVLRVLEAARAELALN
jgi:pimeloyl-ACP methyl ester carboxylesterase